MQDGPGGERNKGQATTPALTTPVLCSRIHLLTEVRLGLQIHARGRASVVPPRGASPGPRGDTASCVSSAVTRGFLEVYEKLSFLRFFFFFVAILLLKMLPSPVWKDCASGERAWERSSVRAQSYVLVAEGPCQCSNSRYPVRCPSAETHTRQG